MHRTIDVVILEFLLACLMIFMILIAITPIRLYHFLVNFPPWREKIYRETIEIFDYMINNISRIGLGTITLSEYVDFIKKHGRIPR